MKRSTMRKSEWEQVNEDCDEPDPEEAAQSPSAYFYDFCED
jgi:hypothetical protein